MPNLLAALKGKRSFILAAIVAVLGALQTLDWSQVVTEENAGVVLIVIGALIAIVRQYTNTAPGKSE